MAELDFSLLRPTVQENAFASAEAGRRHRAQIAEQNAFAKYSQDPNGGIADLMAVNPDAALKLRQQGQQETDRQSRVQGATALANNDFEGAASAYSGTGDADSVLAARNAGVAQFQRQQKYLQTVYPGLKAFADQGGDVAAAFEPAIPQMKQLGFKDEAIAQMLQGFKTNPQATIAGIGATAQDDFEFRSAGDTTQVFSKTTGKLVGSYQGTKFVSVPDGGKLVPTGGMGGMGGAPGGPSAAPAQGQAQAPAPRGGMYDQVAQIAQANGASAADVPYLQRLAQVESNANPNARNGSSTGIFQFQPDTFQSVGGGDINSVADQTKAALALAQRDRAKLQQMGVPVTDANLYIMHQQGAGGGPALLTAPPEVNAIAALTPAYGGNAARARQAIVGNGGREDMTAGEFVNYWQNRWNGAGQGGSQPAPTQQAQASGSGMNERGDPVGTIYGNPKAQARPATAAEKAAYGIPANIPAQMKPDGSIDVLSGTGTTQKPIPRPVMQGYLDNQASVRKLGAALAALNAYPNAVGLSRVGGENINQRLDPKGVDARAAIADVGSLIIHDRSGAAVTVSESPRLMPFIPAVTDTPDAARKKLTRLLGLVQEANTGIAVAYDPSEGYQPLPQSPGAAAPGAARTDAPRKPMSVPKPARSTYEAGVSSGRFDTKAKIGTEAHPYVARDMATANRLPKGTYVILPNGALGVVE